MAFVLEIPTEALCEESEGSGVARGPRGLKVSSGWKTSERHFSSAPGLLVLKSIFIKANAVPAWPRRTDSEMKIMQPADSSPGGSCCGKTEECIIKHFRRQERQRRAAI